MKLAAALTLPTLLLTGCDNVAEMPGVDSQPALESRPLVDIQGQLIVAMAMEAVNPESGMSLGTSGVMVEYEPGQRAVIYTGSETEFVNLKRRGDVTTYQLGKEYLVRGYDVEPVGKKNPDGTTTITKLESVDRWIEATHVELLEGQDDRN